MGALVLIGIELYFSSFFCPLQCAAPKVGTSKARVYSSKNLILPIIQLNSCNVKLKSSWGEKITVLLCAPPPRVKKSWSLEALHTIACLLHSISGPETWSCLQLLCLYLGHHHHFLLCFVDDNTMYRSAGVTAITDFSFCLLMGGLLISSRANLLPPTLVLAF